MKDPGAYVTRATRAALDGRATHTVVDMSGRVLHVTVPRNLGATETLDLVLRHAVSSQPPYRLGTR